MYSANIGENGINCMAVVTVRDVSEEIYEALKARAAKRGHSIEAEIRQILENAIGTHEQVGLGTALAEFGRRFGGIDIPIERDPTPAEPADFD